jgi:hypothetical protein
LEIQPAASLASADHRRANQKTPLGTVLAAIRRCRKDQSFCCLGQQLGAWHHSSLTQNDKEDSGVSCLRTACIDPKETRPNFILSEMQNLCCFRRTQYSPCGMLPLCDRVVSVPRKDISPFWTRSFPVSKEPNTIGEHLRKRRFGLGIRQSEAAQRLGVSKRTLSLWEWHLHELRSLLAAPVQQNQFEFVQQHPLTRRRRGNEAQA